jgi:hypothetical protein
MRVLFTKRENAPERMAAEAEIVFEATGSVFDGLKLVGFSVWKSPSDEAYVTFPARAFGMGGDRRYFDYIRSVDGTAEAVRTLKTWILDAFAEWERQQ